MRSCKVSARDERIEAAMTAYHRPAIHTNGSLDKQRATLTAAIDASDAVLTSDAAIERAAKAAYDQRGPFITWELVTAEQPAVAELWRITVRTIVTALLGGEQG